ncbi:hypothetical protein AVEN_1024-1 [Araneus ventricosus]|uniref:Uncharacterized protein n=1 Tax=Araneus ventricosus TaxID=182803 RepID=A0A4Y2L1J4_ARAVE|nr:hypothetical protein AVEN_1024-1 [Araneus ventricosus]
MHLNGMNIVMNMESRFPAMLVLWLGREFYRGHSGTPDLGDKSMSPENASLFSISLLGKEIYEKTSCVVTACRREYIRTAFGSGRVVVDPLERL